MFTGSPESARFLGEEAATERMKKTGFKPVFENSAVRCDVVTHRGIEPRSTPSESATLSVELMGHILSFMQAGARRNRVPAFFLLPFVLDVGEAFAVSPHRIDLHY